MYQSPERDESFGIVDGHLIRSVTPARGKPYEHRCLKDSFENVLHVAEEFGASGFTLEDLVEWAAVPFTQAATALAFLKERGCIVTRYRRNYPACDALYEDGMIEYHALREGAPGA